MQRIIKSLVIILVLAALAYGGAKGYVYYKVKKTLDEARFQAEPQGELSYGGISTDLRGKARMGASTLSKPCR